MSQFKFKNILIKHNGIDWYSFPQMNTYLEDNGLVYNGRSTDLDCFQYDCTYFITDKTDMNKIFKYSFPNTITGITMY